MRRFRKVRHVPLPLLAVMMAAILFAELARCEREGAKETAAEAEKSVPRRAALTFDDGPNACYTPEVLEILKENEIPATFFLQGQCLAYSARTAHPFQRNGAPFRFKLSKAQQVD